ncbi:Vms1/Ankzf1 family peptidyl-tRNA hydrolase [Halobellus rufus]|uniref:Vms1/Ankzf1 family peptidyl-tRNA hydrolase n=1 Tax=Halobellus rufus TaxID=1448860 RepID=UPI000678C816|nr:Vms1/Ankzf1 family peptidyl-tRNA hydrolase [Halobellus rufus]
MLDELLGRAELKARIEELEEEKRHLERRAAAEEERRSEAARKRQEAEAEVNRLEDKIEGLEERVERLSDTDEADVDFRGTEALRGARRDEILDRLASVETDAEGALTAMVREDVPTSVSEALGDRAALVRRAAPCLVCVDDAGLVAAALDPPTPPAAFDEWGSSFRIERSWFAPVEPVWVALVRSDLFALGVYDGESVTLVDEVESDVMGTHSKGGFSQARFERRRDQQVDEHLDRAREAIDAHLDAADGDAPAEADTGDDDVSTERDLIVLGEQTVLGRFTDLADRTAAVDATGDPAEALDSAVREFWTVRLSLL